MGDRIHRVCHPGIDISYFIHEIKNNTFHPINIGSGSKTDSEEMES